MILDGRPPDDLEGQRCMARILASNFTGSFVPAPLLAHPCAELLGMPVDLGRHLGDGPSLGHSGAGAATAAGPTGPAAEPAFRTAVGPAFRMTVCTAAATAADGASKCCVLELIPLAATGGGAAATAAAQPAQDRSAATISLQWGHPHPSAPAGTSSSSSASSKGDGTAASIDCSGSVEFKLPLPAPSPSKARSPAGKKGKAVPPPVWLPTLHIRGTIATAEADALGRSATRVFSVVGLCSNGVVPPAGSRASSKSRSSRGNPAVVPARWSSWFCSMMVTLSQSQMQLLVDFVDPGTGFPRTGLLTPMGPTSALLVALESPLDAVNPAESGVAGVLNSMARCICGTVVDAAPSAGCGCAAATGAVGMAAFAPVFNRSAPGQPASEASVDTAADAFLNWMVAPRNTLDAGTIDALAPTPATKAAAAASSTLELQQECGRLLVEHCVEACSKRSRRSAPNSAAKDTAASSTSGSWLTERYAAILSAKSQPSAEELALPGVYPTTSISRTSGGKAKLDSVRTMVRALLEDSETLMSDDYESGQSGSDTIMRRYKLQIVLRMHLIQLGGHDLSEAELEGGDSDSEDETDFGNFPGGRELVQIFELAGMLALKMDPKINKSERGIKHFLHGVITPAFGDRLPRAVWKLYRQLGLAGSVPSALTGYAPVGSDLEDVARSVQVRHSFGT